MRKLDLLQISKHLIVANDKPGIPASDVPIPPLVVPERPAVRPRDAPDHLRAARSHAPNVRLNRALRPRRRA